MNESSDVITFWKNAIVTNVNIVNATIPSRDVKLSKFKLINTIGNVIEDSVVILVSLTTTITCTNRSIHEAIITCQL